MKGSNAEFRDALLKTALMREMRKFQKVWRNDQRRLFSMEAHFRPTE